MKNTTKCSFYGTQVLAPRDGQTYSTGSYGRPT